MLNLSSGISSISPLVHDAPHPAAAELTGDESAVVVPPDPRTADQYNRLKAMFAKYNMDFDDSTWSTGPSRQSARVEKPIRMRVRIVCHYCRTNYSGSRECTNCQHRRCEICTRVPPKNKRKAKEREPDQVAEKRPERPVVVAAAETVLVREAAIDAGTLSADEAEDEADVPRAGLNILPRRPKRRKEIPLIVSSRTGGQDLVRKPPLQRVHRTCCKCQRSFVRDSKECSQCRHLRCTKCPRMPPKLDKWPNGYPGDVIPAAPERKPRQWKKPRVRVTWTCHECRKLFMEGEYRCASCSHARCVDCQREPSRRARQQFSQAAVTSVQEKLAAVGVPPKQPDVAEDSSGVASSLKDYHEEEEAPEPSEGAL